MNKLKLALLTFVLFLFAGSGSYVQAQCSDEHKALLAKLDQSMESKDPEFLREIYHADAKRHTAEGTLEGVEKMIEQAKEFYADIPDASGVNDDVICSGDKIVMRWTGTGTPKGAPNKISVSGITIVQFKDGKITEEWEAMDYLSLMMQMGYTMTSPEGMDGN